MGHALHFLDRLRRVEPWHAELSLALYRDPALVRSLLTNVSIPDQHRRVALALDDGGDGPHLILDRSGAFITCLGHGMKVYDTFVIPRATLDSLRDWKQQVERSLRALDDDSSEILQLGGAQYVLRALVKRAHRLSREEFRALRQISPLIWSGLISEGMRLTEKIIELRDELVPSVKSNIFRPQLIKNFSPLLHEYWEAIWACNHIMILSCDWDHALTWELDRQIHEPIYALSDNSKTPCTSSAFALDLFLNISSRHHYLPHMARASWAAARHFHRLEDTLLRGLQSCRENRDWIRARWYLSAMIAYALPASDEQRQALEQRLHPIIDYTRVRSYYRSNPADPNDPARPDLTAFTATMLWMHGQRYYPLRDKPLDLTSSTTWREMLEIFSRSPEHHKLRALLATCDVSEQDALLLCYHLMPLLNPRAPEGPELEKLIDTVSPHLFLIQEPEDLYLETSLINQVWDSKPEPDVLAHFLSFEHSITSAPIPRTVKHEQPKVGRNDPCPCQSGKKYKKCCGA
jgi:hypothetical protein